MSRAQIQGLARVPLQALRFHPRNIRTNLGDLDELTASIRAEGVLVPLMAHRTPGGGLQLLHGHRRWAAADLAGLRTVPVVILEQHLTDGEAILLMLAEDKKEAVDAADRRRAVKALRDEFDFDDESIAERLGLADTDALNAWLAGKGGAFRAPSPRRAAASIGKPATRTRAKRPVVPRVKPTVLYELVAEWDGKAPAELLEQLRVLLAGWQPTGQPARPVLQNQEHDEVEVQQLVAGDRRLADASTAAAAAAVRQLTDAGMTAAEIAARLGCTSRSVVRYRSALKAVS